VSSVASSARRKAQESGSAVADVAKKAKGPASKAKVPAVAGVAAAAGLAAGTVLARNGSRKRIGLPRVSKPKVAKALGKTAKEIGKAGYRAGELSAEIRRAREQMTSQK
jgi:hypothetical protein